MKIRNTFILVLFPFIYLMGQSNIVDYSIVGNESSEYSTDLDTLSGFIYLVGNTNECGSNDGFVLKYKEDSIYKRTIVGSESIEIIESIETKPFDQIYVGGYTNLNNDYDVYLAKLDTQLNITKTKTIALPNWNFCHDIATANNSIIGVGETHNGSDYDAFMFKTDNNLDTLWTKSFVKNNDQKLSKVIAYNDSIFIACGYTEIDGLAKDILLVSFNINTGDTLWTNHYGGVNDDFCSGIIKTNDGGIAGFGTTSSYNSSNEDTYLFKTDSAGVFLWSNLHQVQTAMNIYNDNGIDLVQLQNGDFIVTAITESFGGPGVKSTFIIKTDPSGVFLDGYIYDGGQDDYPTAIIKTNDSTFFVSGIANAQTYGYSDAYLLKIQKIIVNSPITIHKKYIENICFVSIDDVKTKSASLIYPNPIKNQFLISNDENKFIQLNVYNLIGNLVYQKEVMTNQTLVFPTELNSGTYVLETKEKGKIEYTKIIYAK